MPKAPLAAINGKNPETGEAINTAPTPKAAPEPADAFEAPIQQATDAICVCGQPLARMRSDGPAAAGSCIKFLTGGAHKSCQRNIPAKDIFWGVRKPKSSKEEA